MSMNPFREPSAPFPSWMPRLFARWPATSVLVVSLLIGAAIVVWRAQMRVADAMSRARIDALTVTSQLELLFSQTLSAVEVLGAVAKQSGGPIEGFETLAADLLASRPAAGSLQLLPAGVVTQIVPRATNQAAIGLNILQDPEHRIGVNQAARRRSLTVAGPLRLHDGQMGLTAIIPIFQRSAGREAFWGFVAGSIRFTEVLQRAKLDDLSARGYTYLLLGPGRTQGKGVLIAGSGRLALSEALQQPLRVGNLELSLALRPAHGWANRIQVAVDAACAAVIAGLLCFLVRVWSRGGELAIAASAAHRQLAREIEERTAAQKHSELATERALVAETELKRANAALDGAQLRLTQFKTRLDAAEEREKQTVQAAETRIHDALAKAREAEFQLETKTRAAHEAAQKHQNELAKVEAALAEARQTVAHLETRLDAAARAQKEAAGASQLRLEKSQAGLSDLQSRLDAATRSAAAEAKKTAARVENVEAENGQLKEQLAAAQARVAELTAQLKAPQEVASKGDPDPNPPETPLIESLEQGRPAKQTGGRRHQLDLFGGSTPTAGTPPEVEAQPDEEDELEPAPRVEACPIPAPAEPEPQTETGESLPGPVADTDEAASNPDSAEAAEPSPSEKVRPAQHTRPGPPVNVGELRKALHQILPLLADGDPGAKDCLKDNQATFRSAFASDGYDEFDQLVKRGSYSAALELLRKAARKRGVSI